MYDCNVPKDYELDGRRLIEDYEIRALEHSRKLNKILNIIFFEGGCVKFQGVEYTSIESLIEMEMEMFNRV